MKYDEQWYNSLDKPKFQPPAYVFAPVWIFLYITMGVAYALVYLTPFSLLKILASIFFVIQLIINLSWTPAFFKEHNLRKAFLISVLLFLFVLITMILFFVVYWIAGLMFIPYLLWCGFACILSYHILDLNEL